MTTAAEEEQLNGNTSRLFSWLRRVRREHGAVKVTSLEASEDGRM